MEKTFISKSTKRKKRISALFLAPSFTGVMVFFLAPMFVVFFYSVIDNPVNQEFVLFDNFVSVFNNYAFRSAIGNTAKFSAIGVPLVVALSLLVALALDKEVVGKSKIRSLILSPMMVPIASVILIWQVLFNLNGVVNEVARRFDLTTYDWLKSPKAIWVVVILFVWKNLGYNMILFMAALANIPEELVEVAKLDGGSDTMIFWTLKIRYLSSTILFVTILSLINSFKVFRELYLLSGDHPTDEIYMLQHYMNNMFRSLDYQKLSAAAILMAFAMIILVALLFIAENFVGKDLED